MELEEAKSALSHIDADDRETWLMCCFALKNEFGDKAHAIWDQWSQTSPRYDRRAAMNTWKNAKTGGKVGIGSLIYLARKNGWTGKPRPMPKAEMEARQKRLAREKKEEARKAAWRAKKAAQQTDRLILASRQECHPYLESKGFPDRLGLVVDRDVAANAMNPKDPPYFASDPLLIPLRDARTRAISTCQLVLASGEKRFLPGGKFGGCVHALGARHNSDLWFVEGYATGLSLMECLRRLHHNEARIFVCFSAHNLVEVAKRRRGRVIADHDRVVEKTGQRPGIAAAEKTGLPWWTPPDEGMDANDFVAEYGLDTLIDEVNKFIMARK